MTVRSAMARAATWIAVGMVAIAGCSDDDERFFGTGTCAPTTHTEADPAGATAYCEDLSTTVCHRGFTDCVAEVGLAGFFSSEQECVAITTSFCASDSSNSWYDGACGQACLLYAANGPCAVFEGEEPQACTAAVGALPTPVTGVPACSATIAAGTISDTITLSDPLFDGGYAGAGHARAYCISLVAGQSVTIRTAAPLSGTGIGDSVVHLVDAIPAQLAYNDDGGDGMYSLLTATVPATGQYRIVVRGYDSADVGSYQLVVTVL